MKVLRQPFRFCAEPTRPDLDFRDLCCGRFRMNRLHCCGEQGMSRLTNTHAESTASGICNLLLVLALSRNDAVEKGSTRLWRVVFGVSPNTRITIFVFTVRWKEFSWLKSSPRRLGQHARRVRSPCSTASFRLRAKLSKKRTRSCRRLCHEILRPGLT
jgi:hypothetical protein